MVSAPLDLKPRRAEVLSVSRRQLHRVAYLEWGDPDSDRVVFCVHGLSRQGRDFDVLAAALALEGYRVICPDLVGRGRSGRLADSEEYALPQYVVDMTMLLARVGADQIDWVGTSLGGLIGMVLAGMPGSPVGRLVLNDIGPFIPWAALRRLGDNLRRAPQTFDSAESAQSYLRDVLAPFGSLTDAQWTHLTEHSFVPRDDGLYELHYDPAIGDAFRPGRVYNLSLWSYWDAMSCPVLVLRGQHSDLLLPETAAEMVKRQPTAELVEIEDCGHAPALLDRRQVDLIVEWLRGRA